MKAYACGIMTAGVCALVLGALGCESPELSDASTASTPAPTTPAPEPEQPRLFAEGPVPLAPEKIPVTDVPRKVDAHDPVAGRHSAALGSEGVGTTSVGAGFYAKHQLLYLAIDESNKIFWGINDLEWPKSHEDFMAEVVPGALNGQELPELGPGREYIYVPEQGEVGLQIRLTPGSPESKLPAPAPGQEHIYDPAAVAAAGVPVPGYESAAVAPAGDAGTPPAEEQPPVDIRSRAEALGDQQNSRIEEHGLAPGGLAPVGGLE
jgi:hypothetical protein